MQTSVHNCSCMYIHTCICRSVYICIYIYVYKYIHMYMYVFSYYACVYTKSVRSLQKGGSGGPKLTAAQVRLQFLVLGD